MQNLLSYLVALLSRANLELLVLATTFLRKLSIYAENKQKMAEAGLVQKLAVLLHAGEGGRWGIVALGCVLAPRGYGVFEQGSRGMHALRPLCTQAGLPWWEVLSNLNLHTTLLLACCYKRKLATLPAQNFLCTAG